MLLIVMQGIGLSILNLYIIDGKDGEINGQ
jgi:hypothetical protein